MVFLTKSIDKTLYTMYKFNISMLRTEIEETIVNETHEKRKNRLQALAAVMAVAGLYALMQLRGITCPIKYVTGISCAGCGMTRAYLSLLRLDINAAFTYHPLFWLVPVVALVIWKKQKIKPSYYKAILIVAIVLLLAVYIYRMIQGDGEIVIFKPEDGMIIRFLNNLFT